jgi:malonyl-CoA decarboxylase
VKVRYNSITMARFLDRLLRVLRERRGSDTLFMCRHLLSERGEASQTALAQEIINAYRVMNDQQRQQFFEMLSRDFAPDPNCILRAVADYQSKPGPHSLATLSAAVESPRQELFRRLNTAQRGTETLVAMREHVLASSNGHFAAVDVDLRHLFRSWFNRGFLRLERISWHTSALILEKLIAYESVHEINGWPDLHRRLEADRRCFAFFHPALVDEPIIFVEVALSHGLTGDLEPLLDVQAPVLPPEKADTAIFYSINNCLRGLRGVPFGNFLIKQVVAELAAELPNIQIYSTLSPLPHFSRALHDQQNEEGFTHDRLSRLVAEDAKSLTTAGRRRDSVEALFHLLEEPMAHREILARPLERLALAYLTQVRQNGKLYDTVATFHLSNGARLERINTFGNLRPYGLRDSFGVTVNYRYLPTELEENHERFVRGEIQVANALASEYKAVRKAWQPRASLHSGKH